MRPGLQQRMDHITPDVPDHPERPPPPPPAPDGLPTPVRDPVRPEHPDPVREPPSDKPPMSMEVAAVAAMTPEAG
jgi:hypothetical protein